jgi:hypothetical protein
MKQILKILVLLLASKAAFATDKVITLDITFTRPVVDCAEETIETLAQTYILSEPANSDGAVATLLLFVGGLGKLGVADGELKINTNNFLLRTRHLFASQDFNVAVMDAASDFQTCLGGLLGHRTGDAFTMDLQSVVSDLRSRYPGNPVWMVGTSRGTIAAAQAAVTISPPVDGLVLTSPMTNLNYASVFDIALEQITANTMITAHKDDQCIATPPEDIKVVKEALVGAEEVKTEFFQGGFPDYNTNPCRATTTHGYFGMEPKVVRKISDWIKHHLN